jgi:hypothetical protein
MFERYDPGKKFVNIANDMAMMASIYNGFFKAKAQDRGHI